MIFLSRARACFFPNRSLFFIILNWLFLLRIYLFSTPIMWVRDNVSLKIYLTFLWKFFNFHYPYHFYLWKDLKHEVLLDDDDDWWVWWKQGSYPRINLNVFEECDIQGIFEHAFRISFYNNNLIFLLAQNCYFFF